MKRKDILAHVDHTLLKPDASRAQICRLCDEAMANRTASVCVNGSRVSEAAAYMREKGTPVPVCAVIGFPLGAMSTAAKVFEAREAVKDGADEIDMVINIGRLKDGDTDFVRQEIAAVKEAVGPHILKVIIEAYLLTRKEKITMCRLVPEAGADYIKTSTGFSSGGATPDDVRLLVTETAGRCRVKAAGGIRTPEDILLYLSLGADRIGASCAVSCLVQEDYPDPKKA